MEAAPNCAICNAPAFPECPCESERLQIAVQQSEKRILEARLVAIREWVIHQSRTHILTHFAHLTRARKSAHSLRLHSLPYYQFYAQHAGHPPGMHPAHLAHLQSAIAAATLDLKRGLDADWRASVVRYPEVLDYFYGLVEWRMPSERAPAVVHPPLQLLGASHQEQQAIGYGEKSRRGSGDNSSSKKSGRERKGSVPPSGGLERRGSSGGGSRRHSVHLPGRPAAPSPPYASHRKSAIYGGY